MSISLIGTVHAASGRANLAELVAILARHQPDIIFAEIPAANLDAYVNGSHGNLESNAVALYSKRQQVDVVPVDLIRPGDEFFRQSEEMFQQVERTSSTFRRLIDQHSLDTRDHGFPYLNSDRCDQAWAAIYEEVRATVEWIGDARLRQIFALWSETNDRRETAMLENISGYCIRSGLSYGVLLLGAGHRKAFMAKVKAQRDIGAPGVSWNFEDLVNEAV
ncbi:hypothetical protein [Bordetella pseudohinzii]|uniref:TraB family n=1 Tax=Bordetella pseudohinzii TaxID=1331258 RepID=A0A0J6CAZ8_9BORD|nr:hypothetical protein [Bordetella pseudohinzii]ANY14412.1 hypothetical protein BBN53_00030 [Bordetella pseudohinzii]KMM26592.1 hypothetical protein L540_11930 [Bordetella pseudohinzii]KXA79222.1 hypothetical protein AW878_10795 [Bordetella pseudohinzii]KXA80950.1 hypothetical protein AW877_05075 [Bordetella pseudohinzii]CUI65912.1 Uncharacterised protein [Bordetella pseudohinzii]